MQFQLATSFDSLSRAESLLARWLDRLEAIDDPTPRAMRSLSFATRVMARLASIRKTLVALKMNPYPGAPPNSRDKRATRALDDELQLLIRQASDQVARLRAQFAAAGPAQPAPRQNANDNSNVNDNSAAQLRADQPPAVAPVGPAAPRPLAAPAPLSIPAIPSLGAVRAVRCIPLLSLRARTYPQAPRAVDSPSAPGPDSSPRPPYLRPLRHLRGWRAPDADFFASLAREFASLEATIARQLTPSPRRQSAEPRANVADPASPGAIRPSSAVDPAPAEPVCALSPAEASLPPWPLSFTRPPRRHPPP